MKKNGTLYDTERFEKKQLIPGVRPGSEPERKKPNYTWFRLKEQISAFAGRQLGITVETDDIILAREDVDADMTLPVFKILKKKKMPPGNILEALKGLPDEIPLIESVCLQNSGYLNFYINWDIFSQSIFDDFKARKEDYGRTEEGKNKSIVIDYSSPNIAKPFNIGHLRSTIIGQAIVNIYRHLGYTVVGDNHLGDWGTQFGKLIVAYKKWGSREAVEDRLIAELVELYVRFHTYIDENLDQKQEMEDDARLWFKKLETGDKEALDLWRWFVDISLKEFKKTYALLDIEFDLYLGESHYNKMLPGIVQETLDKGIASYETMPESRSADIENENVSDRDIEDNEIEEEEKVIAVRLDQFGIDVPLLVQKNDGTSLYATRDLATAKYRIERFNPEKILYVVGGEQQLYFKQVFKTLELLGYPSDYAHIWFGLVSLPEGKMSTRKGRFIYLEDVLKEAIKRAAGIIGNRGFNRKEIEEISRIIGVGAVKYADLSQNRTKDIVFNWEKMLNLKGNSGPYIQYVAVRINSILRNAGIDIDKIENRVEMSLLTKDIEKKLLKSVLIFPQVIADAAFYYEPHRIAQFLFQMAQSFNNFYQNIPVNKSGNSDLKNARLCMIKMVEVVIRKGLNLLGLSVPPKM